MAELHETMMGRKFFEHDIPEISRTLNKIAEELKRANDLKEKK